MCELCKGTHLIHEVNSFGYRTSCCPQCGPEPSEIWHTRMESIIAEIRNKKEAIANGKY